MSYTSPRRPEPKQDDFDRLTQDLQNCHWKVKHYTQTLREWQMKERAVIQRLVDYELREESDDHQGQ